MTAINFVIPDILNLDWLALAAEIEVSRDYKKISRI